MCERWPILSVHFYGFHCIEYEIVREKERKKLKSLLYGVSIY